MNKILITQRLQEVTEYKEIRGQLDVKWAELLVHVDLLPIVLPVSVDFNDYLNICGVKGVLFTGGNDLSSVSDNALSRQRDHFEKRLLEECVKRAIPVFGICRGMQLIAEHFKYSLKKITGHTAVKHPVHFCLKDSRYFAHEQECREVNSYHNYSVSGSNEEFLEIARSKEGQLEAFEHRSLPVAGIMWHPERVTPFLEADMLTIKSVFEGNI